MQELLRYTSTATVASGNPEMPCRLCKLGRQLWPLASGLCHAMQMEKKPPAPDPNSKFAEVKRKAAELRAKKQSAREEQNRRAEQVPRELDEAEEP